MHEVAKPDRQVRFGVYEFDPHTRELRKNGMKIRLAGQPVEVLATLLERPRELVTREELQKRLWPNDSFVDFDYGINAAINRLREALDDSADNPRFVETLPRRGYRFIAPVVGTGFKPVPTAASLPHWTSGAALAAVASLGLLVYFIARPLPPPRIRASRQLTNDGHPKWAVIETDGIRIYFSETTPKAQVLAAVSTTGGEPMTIPTSLKFPTLEGISPDGAELVAIDRADEDKLYIVSAMDGSTRRLGDAAGDSAAWLADGKITYFKERSLYVINRDGSGARELVTTSQGGDWPRSSPDASLIRFDADGIWEVGNNGGGLHPLLPGSAGDCCGSWTPDQKYYVFQSNRSGVTGLWALREKPDILRKASHGPVPLAGGGIGLSGPIASKDGRTLFALGSTSGRVELLQYNSKLKKFGPFLSGLSADWVDFSKDGKWIAYSRVPDRTLWRSKVDGSDRLQLTYPPLQVQAVHWSPDGKSIAFFTTPPGKPLQIFVVSAEGGPPEQLLPEDHNQADPTWSPDSKSILFSRNTEDRKDRTAPGLYVINLGTHQTTKVPGSEGLHSPRWSPDGRYISALALDSTEQFLFDFKTGTWHTLVKGFGGFQNWSRDGLYVYYWRRGVGVTSAIDRVRISDRSVERVADLKRTGWWWFSGLTPDGSPLVPYDATVSEIFALDWEAP